VYLKGQWEVDLNKRELRSRQVVVPVGGRAFEIIEVLVEMAGQTVTKKDLMARVWPGSIVEDNTLQVHIAAVRRALGTDRELLKTVSGRGYRLLGDWQIVRADEPRSEIDGRPAQLVSGQSNLPQRSSELIGRHHAIRQLRDLASAYRLVTLTGPGGIGKTTLAQEVARELGPNFDNNIQLVELAPILDPDLVPSAVASVLGLQLAGGEISPMAVAQAIGASNLLLILDNCEHVVEVAARFAETILRQCSHVSILATSRELLRIDGEFAYRVAPLDIPPDGALAVETAREYSAMTLFLARLRAGQVEFELSATRLASAIAICRRLDGIPLALELAAARAVTLGIDEVVSRLDDRFGLLTSGRRTALPQHRTLRAMLDWSYDLLPNAERIILQRLAVFVGGFTLEAASAVAATAETDGRDVVDGLVSLTSKSLVSAELAAGQPRYSLLETVRAYALEKLTETADLGATRLRHARYFQGLFQKAEAQRGTRLITEWLAIYARELDNVRIAIDWAFSAEECAPIAVELCADSISMMFDLSLVGEGRRRAEQALSAIEAGVQVPPRREMQVLAVLQATRIYTDGPSDLGRAAWNRVLAIATESEDLDYRVRALWGLWNDNLYGGWPRLSLDFARQFEALTATLSDPVMSMTGTVLGRRLIGTALHYCGDQNAARPHLEHVLSQYARSDHRWKVLGSRVDHATVTRATFSRVLWLQGYPDQARGQAHVAMQDAVADDHLMSVLYVLVEAIIPISLFAGDFTSDIGSLGRCWNKRRGQDFGSGRHSAAAFRL
jgi:predicted ATPase/DNA-binding winged helix-turn-helix (wHTH) protein